MSNTQNTRYPVGQGSQINPSRSSCSTGNFSTDQNTTELVNNNNNNNSHARGITSNLALFDCSDTSLPVFNITDFLSSLNLAHHLEKFTSNDVDSEVLVKKNTST